MQQLQEFKKKLDPLIHDFFTSRISEVASLEPIQAHMLEVLQRFSSGGKRIRAALLYYGYRCFRDDKEKSLTHASMAMELVQSYLLIHDDIIDRDSLRRGKPTVHTEYETLFKKRYKNRMPSSHFGISMATLAGDLVASLASLIVLKSDFPIKHKLQSVELLHKVLYKVIFGQALDFIGPLEKFDEEKIDLVNNLKTVSYTIEGPLHIGAILAGATKQDLKILSSYAIPIGKAFQIRDDILGIFGNERKIGKTLGSDLKEGKKTILLLRALEMSPPKERKFIRQILGKKASAKDVFKVREIVTSSGALDYCQEKISRYTIHAKAMIKDSNFKSDAKIFLLDLADYLEKRTM